MRVGFSGLGVGHPTPAPRITSLTLAPCSRSRAAVSRAEEPPPTTSTSLPRNSARSACSDVWETRSEGNAESPGGKNANGIMPVATTTRAALICSPLAVRSRKPPDDACDSEVISVSSTLGTSLSANQLP